MHIRCGPKAGRLFVSGFFVCSFFVVCFPPLPPPRNWQFTACGWKYIARPFSLLKAFPLWLGTLKNYHRKKVSVSKANSNCETMRNWKSSILLWKCRPKSLNTEVAFPLLMKSVGGEGVKIYWTGKSIPLGNKCIGNKLVVLILQLEAASRIWNELWHLFCKTWSRCLQNYTDAEIRI